MTANFVSALKAEITQLENELHGDPRYRKLARLREILAEYEPANKDFHVQLATGSFGIVTAPAASKGNKIKAEITALLQQRGTSHRKEILGHLKDIGLMGKEKDPMGSLAAYLSGWNDIFDPDGGGNWSLKGVAKAAE